MSFSLAMLRAMEAEGLALDAIIRILSAGEPSDAAAKRRAYDRERKREKREDAKAVSTGLSTGNPPDPAPNERDILTPTHVGKTEPKGSSKNLVETEKRRAVGSCLKAAFNLPDDIPAEPWGGFEEMRKRIRKPLTDHARSLAVTELRRLRDEEGWPPGEVLNHCTMNSYQGLYPPKRDQRNERADPTTAAVNRLLGHA